MTRDHAQFIAARVPGAAVSHGDVWVKIADGLTRVTCDYRGRIELGGYSFRQGYTSAITRELHEVVTAFESAIAAAEAAGFPGLRERKDGDQ